MKTLYISDLDGTLLNQQARVSPFSIQAINALMEQGLLFSYATARSIVTASQVTQGLEVKLPVIVHNGGFIRQPHRDEVVIGNYFGEEFHSILSDLLNNEIFPLVYSLNDGKEKYRYWAEKQSKGMRKFLDSKENDPRDTPVHDADSLFAGRPYYITCIDAPERLVPFYEKYKDQVHCILYKEIYSGELWLEMMPKAASKANAALQLKNLLGCDRLVVFGDGTNDLDLFRVADEAYAMENAEEELKALATAVIGSNQEDGVARWLLENA